MHLRRPVAPVLRTMVTAALPVSLLLGFVPGRDHGVQALIFWLALPLAVAVLLGTLFAALGSVALHPRELRRPLRPPIPWARVRAIALTGDLWCPRPTLWLDDGTEVTLEELAASRREGHARAEENCRRLIAHWHAHRGEAWQSAPDTEGDPFGSWQPALRGSAAALDDAACRAAARRAPFVRAPVWGGTGQAVALLGFLLVRALDRPGAWAALAPNVLALVGLIALGGHAGAGARLGPRGLLRGRGTGQFLPWHRVHGVSLAGSRLYSAPVLHLADGTTRTLFDLGSLFGIGRARAERAVVRIAEQRAAADVPQSSGQAASGTRAALPSAARTGPSGAVLLVAGAVALAVLAAQIGAAVEGG